jgi:hypothetical protein
MAIQNKDPSKKQSVGEAKAITRRITKTSIKHAGMPAYFRWVNYCSLTKWIYIYIIGFFVFPQVKPVFFLFWPEANQLFFFSATHRFWKCSSCDSETRSISVRKEAQWKVSLPKRSVKSNEMAEFGSH